MVSLEGFNTPLRTSTLLRVASTLNQQGIPTLVLGFHRPDQVLALNPLHGDRISRVKEFQDYLALASLLKVRLDDPVWVDQINRSDPRGTQIFFQALWLSYLPLMRRLQSQGFLILHLATNLSTICYTLVAGGHKSEAQSLMWNSEKDTILRCLLDDFPLEEGMSVARDTLDQARSTFLHIFQPRGLILPRENLEDRIYHLVKSFKQ